IAKDVQFTLDLEEKPGIDTIGGRIDEVLSNHKMREKNFESVLIKLAFGKLAKESGIVYVEDAYKLADLSGVRADIDTGNVDGLDKAVREIIRTKGFLLRKEMPAELPTDKRERELYETAKRTQNESDIQRYMEFRRSRGK
ncbi:MAG: hypothetical protein NUW37_06530, partial [Planctomycetes bacterium]|nr:hypothetical protein [Planctomycetota bacterium]